jgi:CrcB protein
MTAMNSASDATGPSPVDPDVDLRVPAHRRELVGGHLPVVAVIAVGGGLGALARFGIARALPTPRGHFPWATLATNLSGCLAIGVLMVLITDVWTAHRLVRPFLGVGVLGGYTTFSTYAVDGRVLLGSGSAGATFGYLVGTLLGAIVACLAGVWCTRLVVTQRETV